MIDANGIRKVRNINLETAVGWLKGVKGGCLSLPTLSHSRRQDSWLLYRPKSYQKERARIASPVTH